VSGVIVLDVGDAVIASPGGSARIAYADGCTEAVEPGSVVTVTAQSPCSRPAQWASPSGLGGCSLKGNEACPVEPEADRTHHLLIGAAVVAAGVGAAILLTQDDDDPASP
jgi:hypothetical protein